MPDEKPSKPVEQQAPTQPLGAPKPKNEPTGPDATEICKQQDENRITNLEDRMRSAEKIMAWLTGAIALLALASVIVGIFQWNVMDRQLSELQREQQPVIEVESFTPSDFPDGTNPSFTLALRNYGHDTATHIIGNTTMTVSSVPISWEWSNMVHPTLFQSLYPTSFQSISNPSPKFDPQGNFTLPPIPGGAFKNRWTAMSTKDWPLHKNAVKTGTEYFYFWGYVSYSEERKPTPFCFSYNANPIRPTGLTPFDLCTPPEPYERH